MNVRQIEDKHVIDVYPKRDVVIVRGKGATLWDEHGKEYVDCAGGMGVANVGHCNDDVITAINEQAQRLITCPGIFYNDVRARVTEKLLAITPKSVTKAFFCNSGAEAVEAAIKFARYSTKKKNFVCAMRGYHGRTMGALSATYKVSYREAFEPLLPGFSHVPYNNFEKLRDAVTEETAGVILEVVQGEGGIRAADGAYLQHVQELCRKKGVLFILDEVQTGFCRTGKMFACEHHDLQPDMMCLAKAIAGGVPMGVLMCSNRVHIDVGKHGTTFGGSPFSCAASLAAIAYMEKQQLAAKAAENGAYFAEQLGKHSLPRVREVRQVGLMIGIELKEKSQPYIERLIGEGVLALPAGPTIIRLLPPLVITKEQLDVVVEKLAKVLR